MQSPNTHLVIIGTGGTIAGLAADASRPAEYVAAQLTVATLVDALPDICEKVQSEQLAQVDSKDMSFAVWHALASRLSHLLADAAVAGIVVTHGTDTLEETAYFIQRVLAPAKPVVFTAAMLPASHPDADGPENLRDAITVARAPGARGTVVVMGGTVYAASGVRKVHSRHVDAFVAGEAGPLAKVTGNTIALMHEWPDGGALGLDLLPRDDDAWPWVEIVQSGAGASGAAVRALVKAGVEGIVAAGTGNGTLHVDLAAALVEAREQGVAVLVCSRCASGGVLAAGPTPFASAGESSAAQARVHLMLQLLAARAS